MSIAVLNSSEALRFSGLSGNTWRKKSCQHTLQMEDIKRLYETKIQLTMQALVSLFSLSFLTTAKASCTLASMKSSEDPFYMFRKLRKSCLMYSDCYVSSTSYITVIDKRKSKKNNDSRVLYSIFSLGLEHKHSMIIKPFTISKIRTDRKITNQQTTVKTKWSQNRMLLQSICENNLQ